MIGEQVHLSGASLSRQVLQGQLRLGSASTGAMIADAWSVASAGRDLREVFRGLGGACRAANVSTEGCTLGRGACPDTTDTDADDWTD